MIRKWTLKRNLVVVNVILLTVALLYSSIMLIRYSGEVSMKNLINSSYDMLTYVCRSVDDFITTEVKISTEVMQSDSDLKEHLEQKPEDYENQHEKLVDIYLMNRYLTRRNSYSRVSGVLAGIINKNGVVYNLQYPMDMAEEAEAFAESLMKDKKRLEYGYDWYPLQKNCFAPETGNLRNDSMIPVLKNLLLDGGGYQGTLIYSLSEEQIYEQYKKSKLLEEGYLYIVDREGRLISHSDESMLLHPEEVVNLAYTKKAMEGTGNYFIENREVVMSQRLNDGNWTAIAVIPLNNMIGEVIGIYKRFIFVIAVILIISVSVSVLLSREAIKPLETMIASMERVENGDFSVRVEEKGPYDIARLIHHYNTMLENTERYIREEYQIKRMKKAAELDALVAQINPHFLYNTLESIVWQARAAGAYKISDMAYSLGKMFNIMVNKGHSMLTVEKELEHVKLYVHLQNNRYNDRFDLKIDLDDEDLLQLRTLKLILQPIVENIILHGFTKEQEDCTIRIGVYISHGMLVYDVEDNGIGIPKDELDSIRESLKEQNVIEYDEQNAKLRRNSGRGIGLQNVHQRIGLYYGNQYGLEIFSREGEGTEVIIRIPTGKS
ncbi:MULTISPECIES: cache domain-containing sensor histidine kinase [Hungatella]|uniref:cache domain-containing sensor histidine kinase n=1 Tax=Hungatella TaxID=1649459 RepID=UPI00210D943E|nr:sensor histidine kinase [Hungatella hathewayi]MCQ5386124.1 sensor histidine kinase [Hungatella hathewayi]